MVDHLVPELLGTVFQLLKLVDAVSIMISRLCTCLFTHYPRAAHKLR